MKENIMQAVEVLRGAKAELGPLLEGAPNLSIRAVTSLNSLINFFSHTAGIAPEIKTITELFPPITEFMGEPVKRAKEIEPEDLEVGKTDKEIFKAKVTALYNDFAELANEDILKGGTVEPMVLRGVAKLAGVEDYQEAELTYPFLEEIRAGMAAKAEIAAALAASKGKGKNKKDVPPKLEALKTEAPALIATPIPDDLKTGDAGTADLHFLCRWKRNRGREGSHVAWGDRCV